MVQSHARRLIFFITMVLITAAWISFTSMNG